MKNTKFWDANFEGECPECDTAFTHIKVSIPITDVYIGRLPTPTGHPYLDEASGEVTLDCQNKCRLNYRLFMAYVKAYNKVLAEDALRRCWPDEATVTSWKHSVGIQDVRELSEHQKAALTEMLLKHPSKGELL